MANLLKGDVVADAMKGWLAEKNTELIQNGVLPCLTIIRVGEWPDDLVYERGILNLFKEVGMQVRVVILPDGITQPALEKVFAALNDDDTVHGILLFLPLDDGLDAEPLKKMINPDKDVDGMCSDNVAKVFLGDDSGYAPCTPMGVMELLKHYEIPLSGAKVALVGTSLVVGKPLSMLLTGENATVIMCHSKTVDVAGICQRTDVIISATGVPRLIKKEHVRPGAVVIDVGINIDRVTGELCGDVDFEDVEPIAGALTPVPGGVGVVTTAVLATHTLWAAEKAMLKAMGKNDEAHSVITRRVLLR